MDRNQNRPRNVQRNRPSVPAEPGYRRPVGAARRPASRRSVRRRKRRMILFSILTLLVVVGIGIALSLTVLFKVDSIAVTGESRYTQEQILAECGLELGENLFLADTESARSVLESRLPYLEDVSVSRKLPSGIVISVSDASPSAVIAVEEGCLLVSARGKALEVLPSAPGGLPLIKGAQLERAEPGYPITYADEQTERALEEIIATLEKLSLIHI